MNVFLVQNTSGRSIVVGKGGPQKREQVLLGDQNDSGEVHATSSLSAANIWIHPIFLGTKPFLFGNIP